MSELGEAPSPTPILDRLEAQQRDLEFNARPTQPKNMLHSIQSVVGLEPMELSDMLGASDPDRIAPLIKKDGPSYPQLRKGFLTSSYLLFNVKPEHTPESWKEYLRRPMGEHDGKSITQMFVEGKYEEILQDLESVAEEEQAA